MQQNRNRLVVLGAAESGIGAALLALKQGFDVFVSDKSLIAPAFKQQLEAANIPYEEGQHTPELICNAKLVVKSPGIPEKAPLIKQLRALNVEICSEIEFAYRYKGDSKIIAITGSNGKSTTTKLTAHVLQTAGYDVAMVGNIGISFAKQVAEDPKEWYVIEVSSFQLDDIQTFRPDIAVILNITPDHLDRYEYKFDNYVQAKFNITQFQLPTDYLILNKDDEAMKQFLLTHSTHAKTIFFTMDEMNLEGDAAFIHNNEMHIRFDGDDWSSSIDDLTIKGKHNQYNSMAAGISSRVAHIRKEKIRESFESFQGLEHRLEFVATIRGVDYINDSKATNVNSVWYALEGLKKPIVLILGGQDKGNDYDQILPLIQEKVKAIVCMGKDNSILLDFFKDKHEVVLDTHSARSAVMAAYSIAERGDIVLLSPACASFDLFNNYEDRGRQFKEAVRNL